MVAVDGVRQHRRSRGPGRRLVRGARLTTNLLADVLATVNTGELAQELELKRRPATLKGMVRRRVELVALGVPSRFSLALIVGRFREQSSTERLADRLLCLLADGATVVDGDARASRRRPGRRRERQRRRAAQARPQRAGRVFGMVAA